MRFKKSFRKMLAVAIAAGCFAITFSGTLNMSKAMGERHHLAEQHAERVERERTERLRDESRIQEKQQEEERRRQYADELEQRRSDGDSRKAQEAHLKENPGAESRDNANINVHKQRNELTGKIISEVYFDKFIKESPKFSSNIEGYGDLVQVHSMIGCSSTYTMRCPNTDEFVTMSVGKGRIASVWSAKTGASFVMSWHLQTNPIVSKKRQPIFEIQLNGITTTFKFKKIRRYSDTGFEVHTGDVHFLDELYDPNIVTATLLLSNEKNELIRIPISLEAIQQWQKVMTTDLKKMKKEYEER